MTFCGRCGHQLGSGEGRFCARCGHESVVGNARYPLYADGSAAVTRPRPRVVTATQDVADPGVTRPRMPVTFAQEPREERPVTRVALPITVVAMLLVVLLGGWLLLR